MRPLCLLGLLMVGCQSGPLLLLSVDGLESDARALRLRVSAGGASLQQERVADGDLSQVRLRLPSGLRGTLDIDVEAEDPQGCAAWLGHAQLTLAGDDDAEARATLARRPPQWVRITLPGHGTGAVASRTREIDCGSRCNVQVPACSALPLAATPDSGSAFAGWAGACQGETTTCAPRIERETLIQGRFVKCDASGFCAEEPDAPKAIPVVRALFAVSGQDVWLVGDQGLILHRTSEGYAQVASPTSNNLLGIWGSAAAGLWAVGDLGTLLHYDGRGWSRVDSHTRYRLRAIWGSDAAHVWAVGDHGTILEQRDGSYQPLPAVPPMGGAPDSAWTSIWGASGSQVLVGGCGLNSSGDPATYSGVGAYRHLDGDFWGPPQKAPLCITALWGVAYNEAWAVGDPNYNSGAIYRWTGAMDKPFELLLDKVDGQQLPILHSIGGRGRDDFWVLGAGMRLHYLAGQWQHAPSQSDILLASLPQGGPLSVSSLGALFRVRP